MTRRAPAGLETEADAYEFLERLRWGDDGPTECPHCKSGKGAWYLKPKDPEGRIAKAGSTTRSQRRVWKCRENDCRRQFSVLTNTVLHSTKMPVRAWVGAIFDLCSEPDGVSARDIADRWGMTEKSAWAMLMRIQDALWSPEAAGASLASNAPLWFEVQRPDENARSEAISERRSVDAAHANADAQREEARIAARRIQEDVQRALAEAANGSPTRQAADLANDVSAKDGEKKPRHAARVVRHDRSDIADQVRSDVERALAEAFAEPPDLAVDRVSPAPRSTGLSTRQTSRPGNPQAPVDNVPLPRSANAPTPTQEQPAAVETQVSDPLGRGWLEDSAPPAIKPDRAHQLDLFDDCSEP